MRILQMLTFSICLFLVIKNTAAVVNNGAVSKSTLEPSTSTTEAKDTSSSEITADAVVSSSETEANKREAIVDFSENFATAGILNGIYGPPIDSYLPPATGLTSVNLPLPVYGVPSIGSNIIYPTPPPDIPPPLTSLSLTYGAPTTGIKNFYSPPKFAYAPIKSKPVRTKYGLPLIQRPPKPLATTTFHFPKTPKPVYGPPRIIKPNFNKIPKLQYGPPKPQYGVPPKLTYGPPKQVQVQTTTVYIPPSGGALINPQVGGAVLTPPPLTQNYGPPQIAINGPTVQSAQQYGLPEPIVHGPPHPGIPSPPTPPDIKYDGWQPIPGLVSRPPSDIYGPPNHGINEVNDLQVNTDFIPPPPVGGGAGIHSLSLQESYKGNGVSDSYGAPLNTVTGSGGVDATSGEEHHQQSQGSLNIIENQLHSQHQEQHDHKTNLNLGLSAIGIGGGQDNSLSVIKSVGYQLFPSYALGYSGAYLNGVVDSYGAPPANSYSPTGPYPSASYKTNSLASTSSTGSFGSAYNGFNSHSFGKEISLSPTGVGLIPPSGLYGVTPSSQYGTPLFQPTNQHSHPPKYHPPRRPVVFREPVPVGLIQSIGNAVIQKDATGIIDTIHTSNVGPAYIPPPVPEVAKPTNEPPEPSGLFSLPHVERPISFQNVVHGSSTAGLPHQFADSFNLNTVGGDYNFGVINEAYALPLQTSTIAFNTNQNLNNQQQNYYLEQSKQVNYDQLNGGLAYNTYSLQNLEPYQNAQHDCNSPNSQPVPQLTYAVPSANGYSAALSSLNTNIDSGHQNQHSFVFGGSSDLQTSHSQSAVLLSSSSNANSISEVTKDSYGKSLGESFANGGELIKSQSLDLNNIPLQGALGSYTLQIQPAGGLGNIGPSSVDVPHEQVLNDGLLQSILAAIEHPQQNQQAHLGADPILQVQADQSQVYSQIATAPAELAQNSAEVSRSDVEAQQSIQNILVTPPDSAASANETSQQNDFGNLALIDNNEIALYFNNTNIQQQSEDLDTEQEIDDPADVRNAQQYGSYVSFKTPTASYVYGDLKADDQQKDVKDGDDKSS
ncbi:hypothetical protein AMK59_8614 [Oryctes borbonicus]|uniref:Uncharacterized protein n=1 Tax=Oryctes borbonicus TaxID=1629725 RepID=A0A0T6AW72_9SCAR|nr:hypothetical protein AMK59_8614 [Oryctes borbonicus]